MRRTLRHITLLLLVLALLLVVSSNIIAQDETVAVIGLSTEPPSLDHRNYDLTSNTFAVIWQIYEPLLYHDTRTDELIPGLAESWEQLDEDSYQFNLRQGVTWHDGVPFTANDVAWSFTRTANRISEYGLDPAQPVEVIDD